VSIIEDGFEDVYNGTVDEFHNFFVGGFETTNEIGKKKTVFVNNLQCGEILLGDKSFCNLVSIDLGKFNGRFDDLENAYRLMVRANFRQTCVDLRDGILQETWHELNQF
jgi:ribonucleoside-triphosphate reductase